MQLMLNPNTRKKEHPKLLVNQLMEQSIEQEDKEVDVERTVKHGRHRRRDPF
tara:strand:+ start:695 stop:850 length:156 start_codon:yes stop_codon:yes gene_type:complete